MRTLRSGTLRNAFAKCVRQVAICPEFKHLGASGSYLDRGDQARCIAKAPHLKEGVAIKAAWQRQSEKRHGQAGVETREG